MLLFGDSAFVTMLKSSLTYLHSAGASAASPLGAGRTPRGCGCSTGPECCSCSVAHFSAEGDCKVTVYSSGRVVTPGCSQLLTLCVCGRQFKIPGCISAYDRVTEKQVKEAKLEPADS